MNKSMFLAWRGLGFKEDWAKEELQLEPTDRIHLEFCDNLVDFGNGVVFSKVAPTYLVFDLVSTKHYTFSVNDFPIVRVEGNTVTAVRKSGKEFIAVLNGVAQPDDFPFYDGYTYTGSKDYKAKKLFDSVTNKRVNVRVHDLVMATVIKHRIIVDGMVVNHIDGNHLNNEISNLEWILQTENIKHYHEITKPRLKSMTLKERLGIA
jgi:hypothetical protein